MKKIYHATLDKNLTKADMDRILMGVKLEDGIAEVDGIEYANDKKMKLVLKFILVKIASFDAYLNISVTKPLN